MAQFGDEFGESWGDAVAPIETHAEDTEDRIVYALRNAVDFKKLVAIFSSEIQHAENIQRGLTSEMLFDIPTAYGKQLDQIGSILRLPREGWDDVTYRVYLRTQSLLVLPGRRGQANLLKVVRSLMDTDSGTIGYSEEVPKTYTLTVQSVTLDTLMSWLRFLEKCRPATYIPIIGWIPNDPFGYDDETLTVPYTLNPYADETSTIVVVSKYAGVLPL